MRCAVALCGALLLICSTAAGATGQAAAEAFAAGSRAFDARDWSGALAAFEAAREAGMDEPSVLYNIGVCRYRLGAYAQAERAFAELAARWPAMAPLAEYNAGLARYRLGDEAGALAAFRRAAQASDPTLARLAGRMLERLSPPAAPAPVPAWSAFVDLSLGFDDNVALQDDASLAAGESTDSPFVAVFGQLGRAPSGNGFGGTASAYAVRYPEAAEFDQDVAQVAGFFRGAWAGFDVELGPELAFSTLDGDGFERRLGAAFALERGLSDAVRLEARLVFETIDEIDDRFAFVDGTRGALALTLERRAGPARFGLKYALSVDDRADPAASPTRHHFTLRYDRPLDGPWALGAMAAFRTGRYDDLAEPREEERRELGLALYRDLPDGWQLALDYRYTSNSANVDAFDYERNRVQLGVNRVFP
jgi:tetratricopeptide (TPR) repeat protein